MGTRACSCLLANAAAIAFCAPPVPSPIQVAEDSEKISIKTPHLEAEIRKRGYVSGVAGGSFVDRKTGFHDAGFGLDIVDFLLEQGSDRADRFRLPPEIAYDYDNLVHGKDPKRIVEGPQICTQAKQLAPYVIRGRNFVAVQQQFRYTIPAPERAAGSLWTQIIVFPATRRYFLSSDRILSAADGAPFLRVDMPGHVKHKSGDTFSEIYLSYAGLIDASEFARDFAPDTRYEYRRDRGQIPQRFIRAYHLRDAATGKPGPWLAGMALNASDVWDAWCHQRGYVSMILEFGGRPIHAGESFRTAFVTGYFDSIEEMEEVYDRYAGSTGIEADEDGWNMLKGDTGLRRRRE